MKQLKLLVLISILLLVGLGCFKKENASVITIGILQTISHSALDEARESFKAEVRKLLGNNIQFVEQNAQGNASQAQAIATSFHSNKNITAIYAIASLAAQTMARVEKVKPIFIAAVTDPQALGIIHEKTNVCGTSDRVDAKQQVKLLQTILPKAKRIAMLYNPAETNSVVMVKEMSEALAAQHMNFQHVGVSNHNEILSATLIATKNNDVLWTPTDNLVVAAMPLVAKTALKLGIPVMASDVPSVAKGALVAQGVDYRQSGIQTARIAQQVLKSGKKPFEIPIAYPTDSVIHVNKQVAQQLNIAIPAGVMQ